jgi:hypothetical protein
MNCSPWWAERSAPPTRYRTECWKGPAPPWTWRTIDEELATLVFDSASELTGVRSEDTARQLTFRAPGMEIEVMVVDEATRRVVGQLVPPGAFTISLLVGDAEVSAVDRPPGSLLVRRRRPRPGPPRGVRPRGRGRRHDRVGPVLS